MNPYSISDASREERPRTCQSKTWPSGQVEEFDVNPHILGRVCRSLNSHITAILFLNNASPTRHDTSDSGVTSLSITVKRLDVYGWDTFGQKSVKQSSLRFDDLDLLAIAFDISHIGKLTCSFESLPAVYLDSLWTRYRQLSRTISRFARLDQLSLQLALHFPGEYTDEMSMWRNWIETQDSILNSAVDKGCTSLHVRGVVYPHRRAGYIIRESIMDSSLLSWCFKFGGKWRKEGAGIMWEVWSNLGSKTLGNREVPSLDLRGEGGPRLTILSISSPSLLFPPFLNWTNQLVSTSCLLTTLIIHGVILDSWDWIVPLCQLRQAVQAHKVLTTFSISKSKDIPTEAVSHFLSGVTDILVNLRLSIAGYQRENPPWNPRKLNSVSGSKITFSNVSKLRGRLDTLAYVVGVKWTGPDVAISEVLDKLKVKFPLVKEVTVENDGMEVVHKLSR